MAVGPRPRRVRAHVLDAVNRTQHVVLDFDGVMFNVRDSLGREAREQAVTAVLTQREYRPRPLPITFVMFGLHHTLSYLAEHEPDHAVAAEAAVSILEIDASINALAAPGLDQLLAACAATGHRVAVIGDLSEAAVVATLRAHGLDSLIAAVAARQGLELSAFDLARTVDRAADLLNVASGECLVVSGSANALMAARGVGAVGLGCLCGRDRRKHLAGADAPVVPDVVTLSQALLT